MLAANSGARRPLPVGSTAGGRHADCRKRYADSSGAFARRTATVASVVNPREQRPSVSAASDRRSVTAEQHVDDDAGDDTWLPARTTLKYLSTHGLDSV